MLIRKSTESFEKVNQLLTKLGLHIKDICAEWGWGFSNADKGLLSMQNLNVCWKKKLKNFLIMVDPQSKWVRGVEAVQTWVMVSIFCNFV